MVRGTEKVLEMKRENKEFTWLKVLHLLDDMKDEKNVHKVLRELNKTFFIKERSERKGSGIVDGIR
jgi:hypothetical protein